jgi:lipoprotein signal peptidase
MNMNPLLIVILAFLIGFAEWFLATRRTIAIVNQERTLIFTLVLAEGILAWSVLSSYLNVPVYPIEAQTSLIWFICEWIGAYKWRLATILSTSIGGALGALVVSNQTGKTGKTGKTDKSKKNTVNKKDNL